ncbi:hypothetical protein KVR01_008672 [Diaporthe batatas]|uniref:uncharacterized protein n=1 Tax=Diaporthe batatas TaxID=748121 RepID=UPI001D03BC54|nr:uncharacterized protein KVR01_008672 [Diaporthe batatas]KAG8161685.1 hypothetical protein KVR01_008672 [Diaporthe batatas]
MSSPQSEPSTPLSNPGPGIENSSAISPPTPAAPVPFKPGVKFWAIIVAIGFAGLLTSLESTITSTALPSIISDIGGPRGDQYIWVINGYFLAMPALTANIKRTALQPLVGQLANVFGRRWPTIISTAAFVLGSGLCGGATTMGMMIAGRVIQGVGAGGINVLYEVIVCDLVPLRQRGSYLAVIFGLVSIGMALGPFFGGLIVQYSNWRWVFYLNLPVGGVALGLLFCCLHVKSKKEPTLAMSLGKIDWTGNALFVTAISSVLVSLGWAGAVYPWSSFRVIVPLVLGTLGLGAFLVLENFVVEPMVPLRLFSNRTLIAVYFLTFLHSIITMWSLYFLPVYFQGVMGRAPGDSGLDLLPTILILVPMAAVGGSVMSKMGKCRVIHFVGFALMTIGFGIFTLLDQRSSTGKLVGYQILAGAGVGLVIPTLLPAIMAPLSEADTALATATWAFIRSFGMTWGTAIPSAIFNNRVAALSERITDPAVAETVTGGRAYQHAVASFVNSMEPETRAQFITVLSVGLKRIWQVAIAFAAVGFVVVALEKEYKLRDELETDYGMVDNEKPASDPEVASAEKRSS